MYRVLLAVDEDSDRARRAAEALTELPGGADELEVTVLNVFAEFDVTDEGAKFSSEEFYDETDFPDSVEAAIDVLESAGLTAEPKRVHGKPAAEIVEVAESVDANCIAISGRRRSPAGKAIFGSVTQDVLLESDRPVLVAMDE